MAKRDFSDAFRSFIRRHITSVEQIEVLLMLFANPERRWTVREINDAMRTDETSIASRLAALAQSNLAQGSAETGYRYAATGNLGRMVEELQREYGLRRFRVIELVFSPLGAAASFADAFRLGERE